MGQDTGDRHAPAGPTPEPFEVFYLREYPKVVGLLHGLLGSRLVAEELAQKTFLVAYRDWDRISRLDNPRAWVRKVAINQRGSFLRAYLRQQTRERHAVVRYEDDRSSWPTTTRRSEGPSLQAYAQDQGFSIPDLGATSTWTRIDAWSANSLSAGC
jgi:DNA-directed RNA polymerase specialized sigma24 family protein